MRTFIAVMCPNETKAYEAVRSLARLHKNRTIAVHETLVIEREADGGIAVRQTSEQPLRRTGIGAVLGGLAGALAGPAGALFGIAAGGVVGVVDDTIHGGVSDEYVDDIAAQLAPGTFAVLAEIRETDPALLDVRMAEHGGRVLRETRRERFEGMLEKRRKARRAVRAHDRLERDSADAESRELWVEADGRDARNSLQRTAEDARSRLDDTKRELGDTFEALETQLAKATPAVRDEIERRLEATRRDLDERERKLLGALDMAQQALRP